MLEKLIYDELERVRDQIKVIRDRTHILASILRKIIIAMLNIKLQSLGMASAMLVKDPLKHQQQQGLSAQD